MRFFHLILQNPDFLNLPRIEKNERERIYNEREREGTEKQKKGIIKGRKIYMFSESEKEKKNRKWEREGGGEIERERLQFKKILKQ